MWKPAKKIDIGTASVVDLKAELFKKAEEFDRQRQSGPTQRRQAVAKKPTVWARPNKGVTERSQKNDAAEPAKTEADARAALERGVQMYEKLERGEIELTDQQEEEMLVDFTRKRLEQQRRKAEAAGDGNDHDHDDEHQGDRDLKASVAAAELEDPWVEYVDEFGRTRTCRKSELPVPVRGAGRRLSSEPPAAGGESRRPGYEREAGFVRSGEGPVGRDDGGDGPTLVSEDMDREMKRRRWEEDELEAAGKPVVAHYNAEEEIRTKGVGFFKFSKDEEERQAQLQELNSLRSETDESRKRAEKLRQQRASRLTTRQEQAKRKLAAARGHVAEKAVDDFLTELGTELFKGS